jgi:hypothetical protein
MASDRPRRRSRRTQRGRPRALERVLGSITFRGSIASSGSSASSFWKRSRARRSAQVRHRRPGVRQGIVVRSPCRSDRPRAARRLRARLVRYYKEEGGADGLVIELPKGGYAPVFKHRDPGAVGRRSIGRPSPREYDNASHDVRGRPRGSTGWLRGEMPKKDGSNWSRPDRKPPTRATIRTRVTPSGMSRCSSRAACARRATGCASRSI